MVCAYGFQKKAFVAVDVALCQAAAQLAQHILHLITYLVFLVPFVVSSACPSGCELLPARLRHPVSAAYSVWAAADLAGEAALCLSALTLLALQGDLRDAQAVFTAIVASGNRGGRRFPLTERRRGNGGNAAPILSGAGLGVGAFSADKTAVLHGRRPVRPDGQSVLRAGSGAGVRPGRRRCRHRLARLGRPGRHHRHDQGLRPDAELLHGRDPHVRADGKLFDPFQGGGWPVSSPSATCSAP